MPAHHTLGAEKKSGVPYILMSDARHRQTPFKKHDQKTRHMGLAHVAQPSYLALSNFGEVFSRATIRCCVRCWGPFGLAQLLGGSGGFIETALPLFRGFALALGLASVAARPPYRRKRQEGRFSEWSRQARPLPWFRAGGGYSAPLFAAQSRHEKPYPPMSKIKFRLVFERQDGNSMPHSPAQRKRDFGKLGKLKFCARFAM